jgi:hypothetical protein
MSSKATITAIFLLTFSFLGGYLVSSLTLRDQLKSLSQEYSNTLKENIQLKETITNLTLKITQIETHAYGQVLYSTHGITGYAFQGWRQFSPETAPTSELTGLSNNN